MTMFSASNKVAPALNKNPEPAALDDSCLTEKRLIPKFGTQKIPGNDKILKPPSGRSSRVTSVTLLEGVNAQCSHSHTHSNWDLDHNIASMGAGVYSR